MKIAFTSIISSGIDTNVRMVSRWLVENGHTVHIIYNRGLPDDRDEHPRLHYHLVSPGSIHYYVGKLGGRVNRLARTIRNYEDSIANAKILRHLKETAELDIAELNEFNFHPQLLGNLPFIYKMHGADWLFARYCEDTGYLLSNARSQKAVMRFAAQVHVVSRSQKDFVAGACHFPPRRIYVTPNPLYVNKYYSDSQPADGPPYRLMTVGRIEPRKGTHTLVAAMPKVWESEPDTHLYIYKGSNNQGMDSLQKIVPAEKHKGRIHFVGYVPEAELIEGYQQSHLYVTAARYETFGYTILEAMSSGCPVIGTEIGPIPELVRHEETGWLVPRDNPAALAEMIVSALRQPNLRNNYGKAGQKYAKQFNVDYLIPKQISLYEEAMSAN